MVVPKPDQEALPKKFGHLVKFYGIGRAKNFSVIPSHIKSFVL